MQHQGQAQKAPEEQPTPHRGNEIQTRRFRLPITTKRKADIGEDLAHVTQDINREREEQAAEAKVFREHIKELESRARRLSVDIFEEEEDQDVECVVEADFEANAIRFRRVPSGNGSPGEILKQRPMLPDERARAAQGNLPLGGIQVQPVDLDQQEKPEPTRIQPVEPETEAEEAEEKCSDCGDPWERKEDGLKVYGHSRKSGKCSVTGCKCEAFMP